MHLAECLKCGFVFNDDDIDEQTLNQFYRQENFYYSEGSFGTGGQDLFRYNRYMSFFKPFLKPTDTIADIGCGKGQWVKYLRDHGYPHACGVELDSRMVMLAQQQALPVFEGSALNLPFKPDSVDVIIYLHILEHLLNPRHVIQSAWKCLKKNGYVFIEVPNDLKYSEARVFDFFWLATIEHINHFSRRYLEILLETESFEFIKKKEILMPYNHPTLRYPSLLRVFQKKENKKRSIEKPIHHQSRLRNHIDKHLKIENRYLDERCRMIQSLKDTNTHLYIWGIGREFFSLSTVTDVLSCNIQALLDINPDKQGKSIDGLKIMPPEILNKVTANDTVLLASVFNKQQMLDYLNDISYSGTVTLIA
jgi:SAM-dependent methyltransferase